MLLWQAFLGGRYNGEGVSIDKIDADPFCPYMFFDPIARVVIVHTGNSYSAEFDGNGDLFPLRDAIVRGVRE